MNKTNDTNLFMSISATVILGILLLLSLRRHHHGGMCGNAGKDIDNKLNGLKAVLDKATQFVKNASLNAP